MVSYAKYSLVPQDDPKDGGESKNVNSAFDYSSAFNYKSAFEYSRNNSSQYQSIFDYGNGCKHSVSLGLGEKDKKKKHESISVMGILSTFVTMMSFLFIAVTFPCTLWFCIKRLQQWERLIVFRLGRLKGVRGPGVVFIIPWLDRRTRVDMRTKAFSVPPQQLITTDNGIIEMGCEVKYRVSDVQQLTTSVTTPQHGLRSFGKTVLLNVLTKHTVKEMERDRLIISSKILKELNMRVQSWGVEIGEVDLSTVNILKEPEANSVIKPLLNALGGSNSSQGGTPASSPGVINALPLGGTQSSFDFGTIAKMAGLGGYQGFSPTGLDKKHKDECNGTNQSSDLIQLIDEPTNLFSAFENTKDVKVATATCAPKSKLGRYLQNLVSGQAGTDLTHGVYRLQVEGQDGGTYILFIANGVRQVVEGDMPKITPDVTVVMSKDDLVSILEGALSPLQAYLSGRLVVNGSIQLLMGLESLRQANASSTDKGDIFVV